MPGIGFASKDLQIVFRWAFYFDFQKEALIIHHDNSHIISPSDKPRNDDKTVIITSDDTMTNKEKRQILTELDTTLIEFYNQHPELNLKSLQRAASYGYPYYKKTYLITKCEASASDSSCKLGENGEPLGVDNPVGSTGNE